MSQNILSQIINILQEISESKDIASDTELFNSRLIDSLGVVRLLVALEEQLGVYVAITEFDRNAFSTPAKIAQYLEEKQKK